MSVKFVILLLTLFNFIHSAEPPAAPSSVTDDTGSSEIARRAGLGIERTRRVIDAFGADYESDVKDLIETRRFFRKAANCTESLANTFLYLSSGAAAVATACSLIFPSATNYVLFTSTGFLALHVTLMGIARCSAREEKERGNQLTDLAAKVNFSVIPVDPIITDDQGLLTHAERVL